MPELYGLLGKSLSHSFSPKFFSQFFLDKNIQASYELFEISDIKDCSNVFDLNPNGLNVTIPYKENIITYLDDLDPIAREIGAVNVIKFHNGKKIGYNSDVFGFHQSIKPFLTFHHERALILGTGGASKAVAHVFKSIGIDVFYISQNPNNRPNHFSYSDINERMVSSCKVIVNCTPVGTFPKSEEFIPIPFNALSSDHLVIDLIYNPPLTTFLSKSQDAGATVLNGSSMLKEQALKSWEIWNS